MSTRDNHLLDRGFKRKERKGSKVVIGPHAKKLEVSALAKQQPGR